MDTERIAAVSFEASGVRLEGISRILMSASLFYFRIPRAYWKDRMEQLKAYGYNAIDVYFPWNYHETEEDVWDFSGERDVAAFLAAAAETGLWVIARPGPYICSEWDGGALPAYLLAKDGIRLRDNNPVFLRCVEKWFSRILPLLKAYQAGEGGTVIAIQLDNELDFYDCSDPKGYMEALAGMAGKEGITVPLFACAGQGGIVQASGLADGVMPTCNFYPDNRDPEFETKVLHYYGLTGSLGYPLLVTETNRAHYLLRRLLSCGAKLLGPYLQVSGTNFGFTNATNNWGKPLAFLTSDYDFGGMISPEGHIREEAHEGRLLGRLLETYGASLAEADAEGLDGELRLAGETDGIAGPYALALSGGGKLVFVSNLDDRDKSIAVERAVAAVEPSRPFLVKGGSSVALPHDVPLALWGAKGSITSSTAELFMVSQGPNSVALLFHADGQGEVVLRLDEPLSVDIERGTADYTDGQLTISFESCEEDVSCAFMTQEGIGLKVIVINRPKALLVERLNEDGTVRLERPHRYAAPEEKAADGWSLVRMPGTEPLSDKKLLRSVIRPLEDEHLYRGYAWYETELDLPADLAVTGLLLRNAADVVSVYAAGRYAGTVTPGGGSSYIALEPQALKEDPLLQARVELWGHSNFDDIRLPGLSLHAKKGISQAIAVTSVRQMNGNWSVRRVSSHEEVQALLQEADTTLWPVVPFGGWLSADHPAHECYRRKVKLSNAADCWILNIQNIKSICRLYVNGLDAGQVDPFDPYVDLTPFAAGRDEIEISIMAQRLLGLPAGGIVLYEGRAVNNWSIYAAEERQMAAHAERKYAGREDISLPLALKPGETAWLYAETNNSVSGGGWRMNVRGSGMKLTVLLEGTVVGRLWLRGGSEDAGWPVMTGGSPDSVYLPGAWFKDGKGKVAIWLEAVGREEARLAAVAFVPVGQST